MTRVSAGNGDLLRIARFCEENRNSSASDIGRTQAANL